MEKAMPAPTSEPRRPSAARLETANRRSTLASTKETALEPLLTRRQQRPGAIERFTRASRDIAGSAWAARTREGEFLVPETHSDPSLAQMRAALARAARTGNPAEAVEVRRAYAAAKLEDYVRRVVDGAPPLTDEQRARIAILLRGDAA